MRKQVILLDQDKDDWSLVNDSLQELHLEISIHYLSKSDDLFMHLNKGNKPALILVDYNSVPDNAIEVLKKLKADSAWQDIPVFVLGEYKDEKLKSECYRNGASAYIIKPATHEGTLKKIQTFFRYWFDVVEA